MNRILCLTILVCIYVSGFRQGNAADSKQIKNIFKLTIKIILCLTIFLCIAKKSISQTKDYHGPAFIKGKIYLSSRFPDFNLGHIINYKDVNAGLSDFNGKIIIFDFWFTGCSYCIEQFPKEDSLQRLFSKKIQIIPVTFQSGEKISAFLKKWKKEKKLDLTLPFIVGDTVLNKCFPNIYYPHYAWLSQERAFIGETSHFFLTKEIIESILKETEKQGYLRGEKLNKAFHLDSVYIYHPVN